MFVNLTFMFSIIFEMKKISDEFKKLNLNVIESFEYQESSHHQTIGKSSKF